MEEIETMKQLFKYYDTDTDGHLTRTEGERQVIDALLWLCDSACSCFDSKASRYLRLWLLSCVKTIFF